MEVEELAVEEMVVAGTAGAVLAKVVAALAGAARVAGVTEVVAVKGMVVALGRAACAVQSSRQTRSSDPSCSMRRWHTGLERC